MERFHSRGHHLCKFIGTKESFCIRKESNSHRISLGHQHGRRFIVLGHQYGRCDVMWKHFITTFTIHSILIGLVPRLLLHNQLRLIKFGRGFPIFRQLTSIILISTGKGRAESLGQKMSNSVVWYNWRKWQRILHAMRLRNSRTTA